MPICIRYMNSKLGHRIRYEEYSLVCLNMSYSGDMEGCHACPRTDGRTECEDRARILETELAI